MLISCEKCSTTYVLDDALIPPQGAPVQCTRCSHVFTARLPQAQPENTPAPAAPRPPAAWESPELANRPANSTLVFGAGAPGSRPQPAANAAPSAPASQTMMFGTPAGQARGAAAPPPPAAAGPSKTLVFGGGAPPAPAAGKAGQTIAFGAPAHVPAGAPPAIPAGQSNQTVIFGTPAVQQAAPPAPVASTPAKTIPFGGGAENRTVLFGMPGAPGAPPSAGSAPASPGSQTMVFGAPTLSPQVAQAEPEPPRNQTMMFGRPAAGKDIPKVTVGSAEPAGYAMGEEFPTESTVRVDLDALNAGKEALTDDSPQVRHDRTVLFAMQDGPGGPAAPPPSDERQNRTVLFAMNPAEGGGVPDTTVPPLPQTMIFGARPGGAPAASRGLDVGSIQPGADERGTSTAPELPNLQGPSLELPPEDRFNRGPSERAGDGAEADDADVLRMRAAANRRTTIAVVIFLVLALALAAALAWYLFGRALVGGSQTAIEAQARDAVALLRRDDDAAHQEAIARARALLQRAPTSVDAQSALVLAAALVADDASAEARREQLGLEALKRRLENLSEHSPSREDLNRRLGAQRELAQRSSAQAETVQAALKSETKALLTLAQAQQLPTAQQLAALRARSISLAVQGEATALAVAEEFNQKSGGGRDNWADLALPEYVANGGSSFDEALRQLEAVEVRDDTFLRAYVLSARIALLRKDRPGAEAQLAKVLAFHPGHDAAQQLMAWVRSHPESD